MIIHRRRGFTMVEVMVAIVLLTVGVMALVGSSAMVSRMIGRGRESTLAVQVATARVERLRRIAASTTPRCSSPGFTTDSAITAGVSERWIVDPPAASGLSRGVSVIVTYHDARGLVHDTLRTVVLCG
ncbi:MAG: prepilin-type N-terminal cleavage/methylation domain-containing protein [Gemmatimonadales bacterium]